MSEAKLEAWQEAGLIDAATAARIRAWEAEHARPLGLWAAVGIAALAIGLGLMSLVAANWEAIPGGLRLSIHFALILAAAAALWLRGGDLSARQPMLHEGALFVFAALGLTFLGHLGQVYQTVAPLWQLLLAWLVLFGPLVIARGQGWLTAAMLMLALVVAAWNYAIGSGDPDAVLADRGATIRVALATGAPVLVAGLGALLSSWLDRAARSDFWQRLEQMAALYAMAGASMIVVVSAFDHWPSAREAGAVLTALLIYAAIGAVAAGSVYFAQRDAEGRTQAAVLLACALAGPLAYGFSGSQVAAGLLFMALWAVIAAAGLRAEGRGDFQAAVGLIAVRLIVLSFELAGDLLTTGAGLIAAGVLILAVAFGALRIAQRFAPETRA